MFVACRSANWTVPVKFVLTATHVQFTRVAEDSSKNRNPTSPSAIRSEPVLGDQEKFVNRGGRLGDWCSSTFRNCLAGTLVMVCTFPDGYSIRPSSTLVAEPTPKLTS